MPSNGVIKQKSKRNPKTKTKSFFENAHTHKSKARHGKNQDIAVRDHDLSQEEDDDEMGERSEEQHDQQEDDIPREKDDTEKQLEKLIFGDDQGFHEALRDQHDRGLELGEFELQSSDEELAGERIGAGAIEKGGNKDSDDDDRALEDVPDSDVRFYLPTCTLYALPFFSVYHQTNPG